MSEYRELQQVTDEITRLMAPSPAAEPPEGLRDDLVAALAGLPRAEWDGAREAARLRTVHGPAVDRLLAGPLAPLLDRAAKAEAAVEPGTSVQANARRLAWFTDYELRAELTRRALDGAS